MSAGYDIPAEVAARLRIGICSWKYDSWKGLVYDPGRVYRPEDYLADYAQHFNTVEIGERSRGQTYPFHISVILRVPASPREP